MTEPTYQIARHAGHVRLSGDLDINARDEVRSELLQAVEDGGAPGIVIDLGETEFIDSEAVGALIDGLMAGRKAGVPMAISNATGIVHRVLDVSGVLDLFDRAP
ncbi:STAS domain-containing protein [Symbioplanes lichenis]|uniref:STAS domain-containing protein n=1 Tax=Symbioplanes lichenis TaxID=1629072 RepID=UPI00273992AD|nr:STAS domain-containing protein [Actinoplanes lichenis]